MDERSDKGQWAETADEGIAPPEPGGEDPQLGSDVVGRRADDDEPATSAGVDPHAGDNADAVRDGGPEVPEGGEPDLKDVAAASREADKDS
jgi:hypothetical protein